MKKIMFSFLCLISTAFADSIDPPASPFPYNVQVVASGEIKDKLQTENIATYTCGTQGNVLMVTARVHMYSHNPGPPADQIRVAVQFKDEFTVNREYYFRDQQTQQILLDTDEPSNYSAMAEIKCYPGSQITVQAQAIFQSSIYNASATIIKLK
jgi:hypothetical protein